MSYSTSHAKPYRIGLLLIDGFALLSYASLTEPLRVANLLSGATIYEIETLSCTGSMAHSSGGVFVPAMAVTQGKVNKQISNKSEIRYDLVMVVAAGDPFAFHDDATLQWLAQLQRQKVPLGGVSGGPVILASAGVLKGYRLTLHWEHAAALRQRQGDLLVERSLYVIDRDRLTCAGGTAPLDLAHAVILRQHGARLARDVSDWLQHTDVRPAAGAQRAGIVERYGVHNKALISAIEVMETHLADPLDLPSLAKVAGVGERQLIRLFDTQMGASTMEFYRNLRLERGRLLLRQSALSVNEIARIVGFSSAAHFATRYRRYFGHAPGVERSTLNAVQSGA